MTRARWGRTKIRDSPWCSNCGGKHFWMQKAGRKVDVKKAKEMYLSGIPLSRIGKKFGVDIQTVAKRLCEARVTLRKERTKRLKILSKIDDQMILNRYARGESMEAIARSLGVSGKVVKNRLNRHKVEIRPIWFYQIKQNPSRELKLQRGRFEATKMYKIPIGQTCQCPCKCSKVATCRAHLSGNTSNNRPENVSFWCQRCNNIHGPPAWSSKEGVDPDLSDTGRGGQTINEAVSMVHTYSKEKGWWDRERNFAEIVALIHSEISESLEEWRNGKPLVYIENEKPEGIAVEMCDTLIRIFDWAGKENINLGAVLNLKMAYNRTRSYRHGKKVA